jgi:signal transduction histidine kinase
VRDQRGSGLGLYLSRGLAQRMNGSLELQASEVGKGSTFLLRLPGAQACVPQ